MPYLSACEVVFHEKALYQVYVRLPLYDDDDRDVNVNVGWATGRASGL